MSRGSIKALQAVNSTAPSRPIQAAQDTAKAQVILLVDDDEAVRETSADMLEEIGYIVLRARGGDDALTLLEKHREIDVMVTDVRMPGMSGLELSDIARRRFAGLKVILISGYFAPQLISRRFLQKPFRIRDLDQAIRAERTVSKQG